MHRRVTLTRTLGAIAIGMSLVAAACGGSSSDGEGASTELTVDEGQKGALESTTTAGDTATTTATVAEPKTMDEWEALWAKEREAMVKRIKDNKWGTSADGLTVTGDGDLKIDLSKCESGWTNTEGLTDTTIKIGQSIAQSGTLADYGNYGKGIDTVMAYYSKKGMFKDVNGKTRTVNYVQKDDGYDANRTIPIVDELLDSEKVFIIWTLGTPSTLKTYDKINKRCVPQPLSMTGHPAWGDPVNHFWTTGAMVASYTTETLLWGDYIEKNFDKLNTGGKITIAALVMNNDFGKIYKAGFESYLQQSTTLKGKVEFITELIEPAAPTVTDPMTTLTSKNPDVFIAMTAGTSCTQAAQEAAGNGLKQSAKLLFWPNTCAGLSFIGRDKIGGDGMQGDGWLLWDGGVKDFKDKSIASDPFIAWGRDLLKSAGHDPDSSSTLGAGFAYAFPVVQALIVAGQLDGGLTRTNFMTALRHIDVTPPTHLWGIRLSMTGAKDSYISEAAVLSKFDGAAQAWVKQGAAVDLNGKAKNCAWDQAAGVCK